MGAPAVCLDPGGGAGGRGAGAGAGAGEVPPATAEEYLRAVMREARGLPEVLRAPVGTRPGVGAGQGGGSGLPPGLAPAPAGTEPSARWASDFLESFAALRDRVESARDAGGTREDGTCGELPPRGDEEGWRSLCFPVGEVEEVVQAGGCRLSPEIVLRIDDPTAAWLLECHVGWLCEDGCGTLGEAQARWFYALAARLPEPLTGGTAAVLRQLTRRLAQMRSNLERDPSTNPALARLNVLLTVAGGHFGQDGDLVRRLHARLLRREVDAVNPVPSP